MLMIRLSICALALTLCMTAGAQVQDIYRINDGQFATHVGYHSVKLEPGKEMVLGDFVGPGKITYFYYTDSGAADTPWTLYSGLVLKVYWDDAAEPSIRVPLWNFFGAFGHKPIDYKSPPMQINQFCFMTYLPMPFSKHARFVLSNDGNQTYAQGVAWGIDYEKNATFEHEPSRLHAAWNRSNLVTGKGHAVLDVKGHGQYIGNFLQVNTNSDGWWGEGMPIFDVDGEHMVHSAGTEDEYGATWDFRTTFSTPYSGYIQNDDRMNRMYIWYLANPVRFKKSLRVAIQNLHTIKPYPSDFGQADDLVQQKEGMTNGDDDYTSVAFWYQDGAHAAPALPPYRERTAPTRSPPADAR